VQVVAGEVAVLLLLLLTRHNRHEQCLLGLTQTKSIHRSMRKTHL
jgi:hypothetical protein